MNVKGSRVGWFSWLIAIVTAQVAAQSALAQTAATPVRETAADELRETAADELLEEVSVTGSRVSNGNDAPTPVTVVSAEQLLDVQPGTIVRALQNLPVFAGSQGQTTTPGGGQNTGANGSAGGVNIRNLNPYRTLVLFDGLRVPPVSNSGFVSVDMIPQMLLQRVDVVTGGASAVYGSDAVSGVVNFITDRKFSGIKLKAQGGISYFNDDRTVDFGVAGGTSLFSGRGHIEGSLEYIHDPGIWDQTKRDFGRKVYALEPSVPGSTAIAGSAANPYKLYSNVRRSDSSFGGLINSGTLRGQQFATNGTLSTFTNGAPTGSTAFQIGGDGSYYIASAKSALETKQAFARFDFDFTDSMHVYVSANGTRNSNALSGGDTTFEKVNISSRNAFLPAAYQAQLAAGTTFQFSKIPLQLQGPMIPTLRFLTEQYRLSAGLDGVIGANYKWNVSVTHNTSSLHQENPANYDRQKLAAALDAVVDPATNQIVCNVSLTNPGLYPGCVPLNLFGPTSESPEAVAYLFDSTDVFSYTYLDELTAAITGAPLSTSAGPIEMALVAEARKTGFHLNSTSLPGVFANCTGLRFNCTTGRTRVRGTSTALRPLATQSVAEGAYEVDVPLLKDLPMVKSLNFNGAVRFTHYDTSGNATTWKLGSVWHVTDDLTVRAARSRDIRAPNLSDLFAPVSTGFFGQSDFLTGASFPSTVPKFSGGNIDLKPERSNTWTAGFVYRPSQLPGFSVALDGYDIKIADAISEIDGTSKAVQLACYQSGGTSSYCSLITRPFPITNTTTANNATAFYAVPINIASVHTYGADLEINYATSVFSRPLSLRTLMTYQPHMTLITPGLSDIDVGGAAFGGPQGVAATPKLRLSAFANYSVTDKFSTAVLVRFRTPLRWEADPTIVHADPKIDSFTTANLNLAYKLDGTLTGHATKSEIYLNIENVFNTAAPPAANGNNGINTPGHSGGRVNIDPFLGRYFTLGVRVGL